jgi:hypothetical protein
MLLKRLADVNQKYEGSGVDNRILKADIETLRAKVNHYYLQIVQLFCCSHIS